jgi:hypothetical protein
VMVAPGRQGADQAGFRPHPPQHSQ